MKRLSVPCVGLGLLLAWVVAPMYSQIGVTYDPIKTGYAFSNIGIGFGARALAMGGAFVAIADDITALSYNPAGLAQLIKPECSFGANYAEQSTRVPPADLASYYGSTTAIQDPYRTRGKTISFDYVGGAFPFKIGKVPVVAGAGYQKKFTNHLAFDYTYHVTLGYEAYPTESTVQTFIKNWDNSGGLSVVTASLAARPLDFLHAGISVNIWNDTRTDILHEQRLVSFLDQGIEYDFINHDIRTETIYNVIHGVSIDLGVLLKFRLLSAGFVLKSPYRASYSARPIIDYTIEEPEGITYERHLKYPPDSGTLRSPLSLSAGIALKPAEVFTISFDYQSTPWSKASVDLGDDEPLGYPVNNPQDTRQLRLGLEYVAVLSKLVVPLRAGGFIDRLLWTDTNGEPVDTHGLTFGLGLGLKGMTVDLAGIYHFGSYLATPYMSDKMESSRWSILASFSFRFEAK